MAGIILSTSRQIEIAFGIVHVDEDSWVCDFHKLGLLSILVNDGVGTLVWAKGSDLAEHFPSLAEV